ncbi:MAG: hypothetical protein JSW47_09435 [Phycisphaerales bacterium]|nr:MAG: hypothetical protein JSW47_09435 [Phycisphaerales bacterium]
MNTRRQFVLICTAAALVGAMLFYNGCDKKTEAKGTVELCTKCGQFKGTESCCKPDQEKCVICGLDDKSPGCCNIPEGAETAAICTACGHMAGGNLCCKPEHPKCSKCGLVEGSPGCCKLPKS